MEHLKCFRETRATSLLVSNGNQQMEAHQLKFCLLRFLRHGERRLHVDSHNCFDHFHNADWIRSCRVWRRSEEERGEHNDEEHCWRLLRRLELLDLWFWLDVRTWRAHFPILCPRRLFCQRKSRQSDNGSSPHLLLPSNVFRHDKHNNRVRRLCWALQLHGLLLVFIRQHICVCR